jgi:hypothetical protein
MEIGSQEPELFKKRIVLVICYAGTDRSKFIADELNRRGYVASYAGLLENHNYVTEADLEGVGSVVFASKAEREAFRQNKRLNKVLKRNGITPYTMDITESQKERALQSNETAKLRENIVKQLDYIGFKPLPPSFSFNQAHT